MSLQCDIIRYGPTAARRGDLLHSGIGQLIATVPPSRERVSGCRQAGRVHMRVAPTEPDLAKMCLCKAKTCLSVASLLTRTPRRT
jgi:hypothetical protein